MPLGDCLVKSLKAVKIKQSEYLPVGKYPIISQEEDFISGYTDDERALIHLAHPIVIFGDHTRVIKYIDFDFAVGADGVKVLVPKAFLVPKFFYYVLHWLDIPSAGYSRHFKFLKEKSIPVPPLEEQERIVRRLDLASEVVEKQKAALSELDALASALFYASFGDQFKRNERVLLKDIAEYFGGLSYKPEEIKDEGTIVLRAGNIQNSELFLEDDLVRVVSNNLQKKLVKEGDILMCSSNGSARLIGKVAMIPKLNEKMSFGSFMRIIRSRYNHFLFYFFRSEFFREQLTGISTSTINQITGKMMDEIKVVLPPLEEQEAFAKKV